MKLMETKRALSALFAASAMALASAPTRAQDKDYDDLDSPPNYVLALKSALSFSEITGDGTDLLKIPQLGTPDWRLNPREIVWLGKPECADQKGEFGPISSVVKGDAVMTMGVSTPFYDVHIDGQNIRIDPIDGTAGNHQAAADTDYDKAQRLKIVGSELSSCPLIRPKIGSHVSYSLDSREAVLARLQDKRTRFAAKRLVWKAEEPYDLTCAPSTKELTAIRMRITISSPTALAGASFDISSNDQGEEWLPLNDRAKAIATATPDMPEAAAVQNLVERVDAGFVLQGAQICLNSWLNSVSPSVRQGVVVAVKLKDAAKWKRTPDPVERSLKECVHARHMNEPEPPICRYYHPDYRTHLGHR